MGCCESKDEKTNVVTPTDSVKNLKRKTRSESSEIVPEKPETPKKPKSALPKRRRAKEVKPEPLKEIEFSSKHSLDGHTQNVDLCGWHPSKAILLTAGTDRKVFLWKLAKGISEKNSVELELTISDSASCFHWAKNGKTLAVGTEHGWLTLWSDSGSKLDSWQPHSNITKAVKINGDFVLSAADIVCVYSVKNKTWLRTAWNDSPLTDVEWISQKQYLVADFNGTITLDTIEESQFMPINFAFDLPVSVPEHQYRSHTAGVYKVRAHPERSDVFASCSVDGSAKVWRVSSGTPQRTLEGHFGYVLDLKWVPNSDNLVTASFDGSLRVWDSVYGDCLHVLEAHADSVAGLDVTAEHVASAGSDGDVHLWSLASAEVINTHAAKGRVFQVAFDSKGARLAATSYGAVELLELQYNKVPVKADGAEAPTFTTKKNKKRDH